LRGGDLGMVRGGREYICKLIHARAAYPFTGSLFVVRLRHV
jgi:hypothetical protein